MSEIKGRYFELMDEGSNRIIFSAAIPSLDKETFLKMWGLVGDMLYERQQSYCPGRYGIRISDTQYFLNDPNK